MTEAFNRASVALVTTGITDVYQAPSAAVSDRAVVISCLVANVDGANAANITLTITDSSDVVISRILLGASVPAGAALEAIPNKLVLKSGEKIRATASAASDLEVTVSAVEVTA